MVQISIIVPVYNGADFLRNCLASIARQTYKDFEVIVVNDGSTDRTRDVQAELSTTYPFLTIIDIDNSGVTHARKVGVEMARGEWLTFVDVDDTLPPNALADLYSLVNDDTDMIIGCAKESEPAIGLTLSDIRRKAISSKVVPPAPWGKLFRKKIFTDSIFDIPRSIYFGEDALMNLRFLYKSNKRPRFLYKQVYNYKDHPFSVSHTVKRDLDYELEYHKCRLNSIPENERISNMTELILIRLNAIRGNARREYRHIADRRNPHPFVEQLFEDIKSTNFKLPLFDKCLLYSPPFIVRGLGFIHIVKTSLVYRVSKVFNLFVKI